ncbi:MAG: cysteinyl-tRNA synthetase [Chloroflexi bacterium]|nr:cysteinyl-tRNA synthetase [Chloroflexota bacterium]
MHQPGVIVLFGSGETAPSGRKAHEYLLARLPAPPKIAILDTPAGFQPNADAVAEKIARFFEHHLQNFHPEVYIIKARGIGDTFDPDDPILVDALLDAAYIFAGPGSPTYAARQLHGTRALANLVERHRAGAILALASAAAIASGRYTLPVYEIFKAGHDLHWAAGLDIFGEHGLELAIVTHWDNREGGAELDTSHCYVGEDRFQRLHALLPPTATVLGVDEHTACIFDFASGTCHVMGKGTVTVLAGGGQAIFRSGESFPIGALRSGSRGFTADSRAP